MKNKRTKLIIGIIITTLILSGCDKGIPTIELPKEWWSGQVLTVEEAKQVSPSGYNLELAKEKGLIEETVYEKEYLLLQQAYLNALNSYMVGTFDINKYQQMLDEYSIAFPEYEENPLRRVGSFGRYNIYIRNLMYIENLSESDISLLRQSIENNSFAVTDELLSMVSQTWQSVITSSMYDEETVLTYEEYGGKEVKNGTLVFVISYATEYDDEGNEIDSDKTIEKERFAETVRDIMSFDLKQTITNNLAVFIETGKSIPTGEDIPSAD